MNKKSKDFYRCQPGIKEIAMELDFEYKLRTAIVDARIKSRLTQVELAKSLGTDQSTISRYEAGMSNPTIAFAQRLIETLGLRIRIELY
ncbi:MAG: helix-turn-helix transcriptional regulator [Candidatus Pacebacteria bacterium]|nr:helix-turn-helix transcriptional regulator [Candidatus Paceibacterota bacterium]